MGNAYTAKWSVVKQRLELTEGRDAAAGVCWRWDATAPFIPTKLSPVSPGAGSPFFPLQSQSKPRPLCVLQCRSTLGVLQQKRVASLFLLGKLDTLKPQMTATGIDQGHVLSRSEWSNSISLSLAWDQHIYRNVSYAFAQALHKGHAHIYV